MKKKILTMASLLLMVAGLAWGEAADPILNRLTVTDVVINPGETAELRIGVVNEMNVSEYGFRLYLPEGITVEEDEYGYFYEYTDRHPKGRGGAELFVMTIMETNEPGVLMFSAACPTQKTLIGNEGDALIITLRAAEDIAEGEYDARLGRIDLSNEDGTLVSVPADVTFKVTVGGTTDIRSIGGNNTEGPLYDLSGRRIQQPKKGINIVGGGKKVVRFP